MMEGSTITYSNSSISDSMMEASKDFVIKLLVDEDGEATVRRIRLFRIFDSSGKICFDKLFRLASSKVNNKYRGQQQQHEVRLSYLDVDDDCVIVDSAEDLVDAIDQFSDQRVLRLFVGEVTSVLRQAYFQMSTVGDPKQLPAKSSSKNASRMEQEIERQIEQILEKRFRMLEQQRRAKETGGATTPRNNNNNSMGGFKQPYGNRGWEEYDAMIGEDVRDDFLSNGENQLNWQWQSSSSPSGAGAATATMDTRFHSRPPHPLKSNNNGGLPLQKERSRSMDFHIDTATPAQIMEQEYDLSARTKLRRQQASPITELSPNDRNNSMTPRRRSNSSMSMRTAAQDRGVIDSAAEIEVFRNMMTSVRRPGTPGAIHRAGPDDVMYEPDDDDDQEYESEESDSRIGGEEAQYQDWELNTVDSDAELSLLLSDTEFQADADHRDDSVSKNSLTSKETGSPHHQNEDREDIPRDPVVPDAKGQPRLPPKPPATPNKKNTAKPTTPNKAAATDSSKFNNIPRPTPPKKNKLIGMLYNNE